MVLTMDILLNNVDTSNYSSGTVFNQLSLKQLIIFDYYTQQYLLNTIFSHNYNNGIFKIIIVADIYHYNLKF